MSRRKKRVATKLTEPAPPPPAEEPLPVARRAHEDSGRTLVQWLLLGYLLLAMLGVTAFRGSGPSGAMTAGNEMSGDRAVFESVNAITLTGFQQNVGLGQFEEGRLTGPLMLLLLTLAGAYFSMAAGGMAAVRVLRLPYRDGQVLTAAATAVAVATLAGWALLLGAGRTPLQAVTQAAAAFGNSGVHTGRLWPLTSWRTHAVYVPLAFVGGLGLPVLMELYDVVVGRRTALTPHAGAVLALSAGMYVGGFLLLLAVREEFWADVFEGFTGGGWTPSQGLSLRRDVASSAVLAVNTRTAGLPLEDVASLPRVVQWVILVLMFVGAAGPAGTGGGVKGTTLLQLTRGVRAALSGRGASRAFGIAAVWVAAYLLLVVVGFFCLLWQVPQMPADQLLFLSVSATSNVGFSHDSLSLVRSALVTLSALMLLGRLLPVLVLWWMASTTHDAELAVG